MDSSDSKRVCVCVLGDIGHSPRMQYHSLSLARAGFLVDIVANLESQPHETLRSNTRIQIHKMASFKVSKFLPRFLNYILKILFTSFQMFFNLMFIAKPDCILVQNPPSVPSLPIVWLVCRLRHCKFIIDWHNYGFTLMAIQMSTSEHFLVRFYRKIEFYFGQKSDFNFCVSKSMQENLKKKVKLDAIVLYDRPFSIFKPIESIEAKHLLFKKLQNDYFDIECEDVTIFTRYSRDSDEYCLRLDRPIILISSTSWTADEDFQLLLDALYEFDQKHIEKIIRNQNQIKLVCFITGKGPMKSYYMEKIQNDYEFKHTRFVFPWLTAEDYPKLLASADLGICLHKSSSGFDLPMKILDMFGSCLPVCAFNYPSISELVVENFNGCLFQEPSGLIQCLVSLLEDFPQCSHLNRMRKNLYDNFQTNFRNQWHHNWMEKAFHIFNEESH
ncbi:Chitobiosyldiphosphodolichol beta-mannosyltransferase [Sarcoptes scabiei]|uniref:Chitobiosyldiphosphodolichol beta-mannosyltransferase n=1 Tax=Sarcoptes scabiei TaxID=52283 RepID=A0A834VD57_SARSC|nr:Chitobiosyldiphosphodolichol beta-mannosyltransferase [Sarcoptes scabiei]